MRNRHWLLVALPLALVACEAEEEPEVGAEVEPVVPAAPVATPTAAPAAGMEMVTDLAALNDSGVTGQAAVSPGPAGTDTQVRVTLNAGAAKANTTHQGHVHTGTCESLGGVVAPLQPITLDATGSGTMTTTIPVAPNTVMDGQHIVVYHEAGGSPGQPVTCGAIPRHQM